MTTLDQKKFRNELIAPINRELSELFELIDYETRFELRLASHAVERFFERCTRREDALRFGKLLKRIVSCGVCELLYFQTRYANGDTIGLVEFRYEEVVVPITFVADYVVMRTVYVDENDTANPNRTIIDLSDSRFK